MEEKSPYELSGFLDYEKFVEISKDRDISRCSFIEDKEMSKMPTLGDNPPEAAMNYLLYLERRTDIKIEALLEYIKVMHQSGRIHKTEDIINALERERKINIANENNVGDRGRPSKVDKAFREIEISIKSYRNGRYRIYKNRKQKEVLKQNIIESIKEVNPSSTTIRKILEKVKKELNYDIKDNLSIDIKHLCED